MPWDVDQTRIGYRLLRARACELRLSESALTLLAVLLEYDLPEHGRRKGVVWPKTGDLQRETAPPQQGPDGEVTERAIRKWRGELLDAGVLAIERDAAGRRQLRIRYDVLLGQPVDALGGVDIPPLAEPTRNSRSAPESGTTVPQTGTTVPQSGTTVPQTGTTVPQSGTTVPQTGTAVPQSGTTVPQTGTTVPQTGTTVPQTGTAVPPNRNSRSAAYKDPNAGSNEEARGSARAADPDALPVPPPDHPVWAELGLSPDEELQRDAAAEIVAGVPLLERRSPVWWDCQPLPHWRGEADEWEALLPPDGFRTLRRWYNAMPLCPDPDRPEWPSWAEVLESLPSSHPVTTGDLRSLHGWLVERLGDAEAPRLAWERVIERLQTVGEQNRATRERWADEKAVAAQKARCRRRRDRAAELAPALRRIAERIADAQGLVVQRVDGLELVLMHPDEPPTIRAPDGTRQPAPWLADAQRGVEMYREQALCLLSEAPACEPAGERS